jgi:hypothetical protein
MARLDNVLIFASPVVSGDPYPDYPPLPSFLDRRKPSATAADAA